jgi:phosphonate transport system ATP-binding protein
MIELLGVGVPRADRGGLLHRVCVWIERGETVVIVSGDRRERVAVLDAISGRRIAEEGRVWVSRLPVLRETRGRLRAIVGEVDLARPLALRRTVLWNALARSGSGWGALFRSLRFLRPSERRAVLRALSRVGLADDVHRPVGNLDPEGRARLHLARELARAPEYLLVREIDAGLDMRTAARVLALLRDLSRQQRLAVVASATSLPLARAGADRIMAIADGLLVFDGPAALAVAVPDGRLRLSARR